jgi:WD40 repeat protein
MIKRLLWLSVVVVLLAACVKPTSGPLPTEPVGDTSVPKAAETATLPPSPTPAPVVISPENSARLQVTGQVNVKYPSRLDWSGDSQRLAIRGEEGIYVYQADTLVPLASVLIQSYTLLDISLDDNLMAVTGDQKNLELRDLATGELTRTLVPPERIYGASFSPDGLTLAVAYFDKPSAGLYDVKSGNFLTMLNGFETAAPVYNVTFAPAGKLIWSSRGTLQVMEIASGQLDARLEHEDTVSSYALSPDGSVLASASAATVGFDFVPVILLWEAMDGTPLGVMLTGGNVSPALAFSPDGKLLASASASTLVLWELSSQHKLIEYNQHGDAITALAFSPDGGTLITASANGEVKLWKVK